MFSIKVLDDNGQALEGVNVAINNIRYGKTNRLGQFTLSKVKIGDTLKLSHISFEQFTHAITERELSGKLMATYVMQHSNSSLAEVQIVNTGYEKMAKERVTGSFTLVEKQLYEVQVSTNALERLANISNGVTGAAERIGALQNGTLLVRGLSTFTLDNQKPLVIVNDFEYLGSLENINPNDIENITILKDAAASSIWGTRAANGVIVISTKKAKLGQALKIGVNINMNILAKPNLNYFQTIAPNDLIELERFLFGQRYRFADTSRSTHPPFSAAYELMFAEKAGKITKQQLEEQLALLKATDVRDEFTKHFYEDGLNQQYSLNIGKGGNNGSSHLSTGLDHNVSNLAVGFQRKTLRYNQNVKVFKNLQLSTDLSWTKSSSASGKPAYGSINPNNASLPVYTAFENQDGKPIPLYTHYRQGYIDGLGNGKLLDWRFFPLTDWQYIPTRTSTSDLNAAIGLNYQLPFGLTIDAKYRHQFQNSSAFTNYGLESFFTRNLINSASQINSSGNITYRIPMGTIRDVSERNMNGRNLRAQLGYNKTYGKHQISGILGTELSEQVTEGRKDRLYGYDEDILSYVNVDFTTPYTVLATGGNSFINDGKGFSRQANRFISAYGNASYTYMDRYSLSASARRDASNAFGVATNQRWKPLWSLGFAWNIKNMDWLRQKSWLNTLKLRSTYGKQGNVDPRQVAITTIGYTGTNPFLQSGIARVENYPNPDLRWEEVSMWNFGLDYGFFGGKITGSFEYYTKHLNDLYASVPIDRTTGITSGSVTRNIGKGQSAGMDFMIRGNYKFGQLGLQHDLIFNTYADRIVNLRDQPALANSALTNGIILVKDYPISSIFSYRWAGLDPANGNPRGYINDEVSSNYNALVGQTKFSDVVFEGTLMPKTFGSVGSGVTWKQLSFNIRFSYKLNYFFRRQSVNYNNLISQLNGHADYAKRWQNTGDERYTDVPSFTYPAIANRETFYQNAEPLITKGNHLRLQFINFSYTLNNIGGSFLSAKNLTLFATASNLGILWAANKFGIDPDYGNLPPSRQYAFGLKINY
ncbi:SusC/RagA family TonB-linked outer membrane protein [Pedobacter sp. UBA4863]|uniref:SusC/RagA family TonB-linked outer membrane protein n=1 Tax=Pedobacter sp. UBA4863 TaxID=1947060 RepID=UPI0025F52D84|nr:SusC/RagA family TonB-linked outer membrane protein [Pedobacter sp. UBA4863]